MLSGSPTTHAVILRDLWPAFLKLGIRYIMHQYTVHEYKLLKPSDQALSDTVQCKLRLVSPNAVLRNK